MCTMPLFNAVIVASVRKVLETVGGFLKRCLAFKRCSEFGLNCKHFKPYIANKILKGISHAFRGKEKFDIH